MWRPSNPNAVVALVPLEFCPEDVTVFAVPDKPCHDGEVLGLPKLVLDDMSVRADIRGVGTTKYLTHIIAGWNRNESVLGNTAPYYANTLALFNGHGRK